jgi:hypothetical protein
MSRLNLNINILNKIIIIETRIIKEVKLNFSIKFNGGTSFQ